MQQISTIYYFFQFFNFSKGHLKRPIVPIIRKSILKKLVFGPIQIKSKKLQCQKETPNTIKRNSFQRSQADKNKKEFELTNCLQTRNLVVQSLFHILFIFFIQTLRKANINILVVKMFAPISYR